MKTNAISFIRILPALLAAALPLHAQDLPYSSGSTGADGPLTVPNFMLHRDAMAYAYDSARNQTVVFGGHGRGEHLVQADGVKPETWIFEGGVWNLKSTATFVSARTHATMAFDPVRGECVMFGGYRADNVTLNETWTWNGTNWTKKSPATSPEPRHLSKMVWDSQNNRVLLFGGHNPTGNLNYNDTWAWNGTTWTKLAPTASPHDGGGTNYYYHDHDTMIWDTQNNRAVLTNTAFQKTWLFNGTTWTLNTSFTHPVVGSHPRMVYDAVRDEVVLGPGASQNQTWTFKANEWTLRSPATVPQHRYSYGMVWDSAQKKVLMFNGYVGGNVATNTWAWDGTNWEFVQGNTRVFDLSSRASGIWNFTGITVPLGATVTFKRNTQNTPVVWLATENVQINGNIILDGADGPPSDLSGNVAQAGPGGFNGGLGAVRFDVSGSYIGAGGQGPGGGAGGDTTGKQGGHGFYNGSYGNTLIQPLVGGSGGGGGASSDNGNGGNGGAGGGAIMIASSKDIVIDGGIYARGGHVAHGGGSYGGGGSGGAIKLVADRVLGTGVVDANGRHGGGAGRIRIEGFFRPFASKATPVPSATTPTLSPALASTPMLMIANVAGTAVAQSPGGSSTSPDVVFSSATSVAVQVVGNNIPSGTPVQLRLTTPTGVILLPPTGGAQVTLDATGNAVFNTVIPPGQGTLQAAAEFNVSPP